MEKNALPLADTLAPAGADAADGWPRRQVLKAGAVALGVGLLGRFADARAAGGLSAPTRVCLTGALAWISGLGATGIEGLRAGLRQNRLHRDRQDSRQFCSTAGNALTFE